jgi:hypothetical protein
VQRCNKSLNNLPETLTHLKLNKNFCKKLDNLPNNLIHLTHYKNYIYNIKIPYGCKILSL